jgi:hypothetical protein
MIIELIQIYLLILLVIIKYIRENTLISNFTYKMITYIETIGYSKL